MGEGWGRDGGGMEERGAEREKKKKVRRGRETKVYSYKQRR